MSRSAEAVRRGHPDKVADQIADALLDAYLARDPKARVALEVLLKNNSVHVAGEVTSKATVNFESVVRSTVQKIGYCNAAWGMDAATLALTTNISQQSSELSQISEAAGDMAIVWGYATDETAEYLPLPFVLAQKLATADLDFPFLRPDGKVLVVTDGGKIESLFVALQHDESVNESQLRAQLLDFLPQFYKGYVTNKTHFSINQLGSFTVGGPLADAGLTGRKTQVDSYGTLAPHGGGGFSGKDCWKVDRSGALAARYIAKNIVASGAVKECAVQIAYAIGLPEPVSINIEADCDRKALTRMVLAKFPTALPDIVAAFELERPIFQQLAFGSPFLGDYPWEALREPLSLLI